MIHIDVLNPGKISLRATYLGVRVGIVSKRLHTQVSQFNKQTECKGLSSAPKPQAMTADSCQRLALCECLGSGSEPDATTYDGKNIQIRSEQIDENVICMLDDSVEMLQMTQIVCHVS